MNRDYVYKSQDIVNEVKKAVIGKDDVVTKVMLAVLARGHVLLEDIPGVGKTTLAVAFSKAMNLNYNRVQFTPDVMPSDVTGFSIYDKEKQEFVYKPGAAMCNLFLADEINRTSSKTQSALLEVMEERQVTVDGQTHKLPDPFVVIATQNPVGSAGTQLLPQAQLDRFMVRLEMGYPDFASQVNILRDRQTGDPLEAVDRAKQRRISRTAQYYCLTHGYGETTPCRFDVAAVLGTDGEVRLVKHAFEFQG